MDKQTFPIPRALKRMVPVSLGPQQQYKLYAGIDFFPEVTITTQVARISMGSQEYPHKNLSQLLLSFHYCGTTFKLLRTQLKKNQTLTCSL